MRQKLIHKNKHTNTTAPSNKKALLQRQANEQPSLAEVLTEGSLSKEEWHAGLKWHSEKVANLLLSENLEGFEKYMKETADTLKADGASLDQRGIGKLDYQPLLRELLQLAILIEHSTIPPYLTALYSIKDGANAWASQVVRSIAVEEMLHMIMVCNVMNAVDIQPSVNAPQNFPSYPAKLPLNVDFYVGLEKFSPNSVSTFIAIESPSSPTVEAPVYQEPLRNMNLKSSKPTEPSGHWSMEELEDFIQTHLRTIGEFYDFVFFIIVIVQAIAYYLEHGEWPRSFEQLNEGGIFKGDPKKQIGPEQYYGSGGTLHTVKDLRGVMEVFEEIKGQGEGADGTIFSTDPSQFEEGFEPAHYFRFKEIFHEHTYAGGDYHAFTDSEGMMPITTPPTGEELPIDWSAVYPIKANLKMEDLASNPALYGQAKAFNKTYKELLDAIQAGVEGRHEELEKSILIMYALKEQAINLMRQPLTAQENAAPTFEYPSN